MGATLMTFPDSSIRLRRTESPPCFLNRVSQVRFLPGAPLLQGVEAFESEPETSLDGQWTDGSKDSSHEGGCS